MASKRKKMDVSQLKSGMVVSEPVVSKRGQVIAKRGTVLTHSLISRLSFYRIGEIMVETTMDEDEDYVPPTPQPVLQQPQPVIQQPVMQQPVAQPQPMVQQPVAQPQPMVQQPVAQPQPVQQPQPAVQPQPQPTPQPAQHQSTAEVLREKFAPKKPAGERNFEDDYSKTIDELKLVFEEIVAGKQDIDYSRMVEAAGHLFQSKTSLQLFDMIQHVRSLDDSVYAHSVNVAMIARAIGKWLKMSNSELDLLTMAGLLHDVGKLQVPPEVLNKTEKLTEEEFALIRKHPIFGNKMLKAVNVDNRISICALQHHERADGTGYPRGLDGDEIDNYASIIAIADVYDAMTAARSYRAANCPFQVIAAFEADGVKRYDPKYILTFLERIASLYQNASVMLSDGRKARVVYINRSTLSKPVVEAEGGGMVDLSRTSGITITEILY